MTLSDSGEAAVVPVHVGIIPDGNRRWAKSKGLPTLDGHRRGVDAFMEVCNAAIDSGVRYITYYAFSTENWQRTSGEVKYLMQLFISLATNEVKQLHQKGIRFRVIGTRDGLSKSLVKALDAAETLTQDNTRGTMSVCLNYGGQQELAAAAASLIRAGVTAGEVTPELVGQHIYAPDIPPVDLLIRTSGEHRTSGFMLWRAAYAEFYFVDKHWPDFGAADLNAALDDFASRQRRFGK